MYITLDEIKSRGEAARKHFETKLEVDLAPGIMAVEWIHGYINRNRDIFSEDKQYGWAIAFGYIIGESIISTYGGEWSYREENDQWGISITQIEGWANPIGKTYKFIQGDSADDLVSFFNVIGLAIEKGGFDKLGLK